MLLGILKSIVRRAGYALAGSSLAVASVLGAAPSWAQEVIYKVSAHSIEPMLTGTKNVPDGAPTIVLTPNGSTYNVWYLDIINATGNGFNDPVIGDEARARLQEVLTYVADVLNQPGTLDIVIEESDTAGNGALASAGTFFTGSAGFQNGTAFSRLSTGTKPFDGFEELFVTVDFGFPWNVGQADAEGEEFDLASVLLHEITHGLGVISLATNMGMPDPSGNTFTNWDAMMQTGGGTNLFTGDPPAFNGGLDISVYTSNNLFFAGSNAIAVYDQGGLRPGIYAPNPFESGSSISHWDTGNIVGGAVMEHAIAPAVTRRAYADFEIGALVDMGWTNAAVPGRGSRHRG
jgi:hypothetical protein